MSDYLRARIEALTREVEKLKSKVAVLEAKQEVSQQRELERKQLNF